MVGLGRLELPTSRLSGVRSNRLSYRPVILAGSLIYHTYLSLVIRIAMVISQQLSKYLTAFMVPEN